MARAKSKASVTSTKAHFYIGRIDCMGNILLLILLHSFAFAVYLDGSIPIDRESEKTAVARVADLVDSLDIEYIERLPAPVRPVKFEKFVRDNKEYKAITLEGGLLLHPSCDFDAQRLGLKTEEFQER